MLGIKPWASVYPELHSMLLKLISLVLHFNVESRKFQMIHVACSSGGGRKRIMGP